MEHILSTQDWVDRAYKKLKGNVYFDKTQLPLIDQLVSFEHDGPGGKPWPNNGTVRAVRGQRLGGLYFRYHQ